MAWRSAFPKKFHEWFIVFLTVCTLGLLIYMLISDDDPSNDKWFYTWLVGQVVVGIIGYFYIRNDYGTEMFVSKENEAREHLLSNRVHSD